MPIMKKKETKKKLIFLHSEILENIILLLN